MIATEIILLEAEREIDRLRDEVTRVRKQLHEAMLLLEVSEPGRDVYLDVESRGRWKLRRDKLLLSLQFMGQP